MWINRQIDNLLQQTATLSKILITLSNSVGRIPLKSVRKFNEPLHKFQYEELLTGINHTLSLEKLDPDEPIHIALCDSELRYSLELELEDYIVNHNANPDGIADTALWYRLDKSLIEFLGSCASELRFFMESQPMFDAYRRVENTSTPV